MQFELYLDHKKSFFINTVSYNYRKKYDLFQTANMLNSSYNFQPSAIHIK